MGTLPHVPGGHIERSKYGPPTIRLDEGISSPSVDLFLAIMDDLFTQIPWLGFVDTA